MQHGANAVISEAPLKTGSPLRDPLSTPLDFEFGELGTLRLLTSAAWMGRVERGPAGMPPTITFAETHSGPSRLLISVTPLSGDGDATTPGGLGKLLQAVFDQLRDQVVESAMRLCAVSAGDATGWLFSVTDRAPKADEYLYATHGVIPVGELLLWFTILTNPGDGSLFARALETIRSAGFSRAGTQPAATTSPAPREDDALSAFMAIDLNCEASSFLADHPDVLGDLSLLVLEKVAAESDSPSLRERVDAARCALLLARGSSISSAVWAPGDIAGLPREIFEALRAGLFLEGPERAQRVVRALGDAIPKRGPAATARVLAAMHVLLAAALSASGDARPESTEDAIAHLEAVAGACTAPWDTFIRAGALLDLSAAYFERPAGDRAGNLKLAIRYARDALGILDGSGFVSDWATAQIRLGNAYAEAIFGFRADNIEAAIACFEDAITWSTDPATRNWLAARNGLGNAYRMRVVGRSQENLAKAIETFETALGAGACGSSALQGKLHFNLGDAYLLLGRIAASQHEKAIEQYGEAAKTFAGVGDRVNWAQAQLRLGIAYGDRRDADRGDRDHAANVAAATGHFADALTVLTPGLPREHRSAQIALGGLLLAERRWEDALTALRGAIASDQLLASAVLTFAGAKAEFAAAGIAYSDAAYCLLRLGKFDEALLTLEKGKSRFLTMTAEQTRATPPQSGDELRATPQSGDEPRAAPPQSGDGGREPSEFEKEARNLELRLISIDAYEAIADKLDDEGRKELDELRNGLAAQFERVRLLRAAEPPAPAMQLGELLAAVPHDGVLVAPVITRAGSAAFVLTGGLRTIVSENVVWIDTFTSDDVERLLVGSNGVDRLPAGSADAELGDGWLYAAARVSEDPAAWRRVIESAGSILWRAVFEPIYARLAELGLPSGAPLILLPGAGLEILPLHAAWRDVNEQRRYVLEDYTVTYSPSATLLAIALTRLRSRANAAERGARSLLVIADPRYDLTFAAVEGRAIAAASAAPQTELLIGARASWTAVSKEFRDRSYLHFACHGFNDTSNHERSFLRLAVSSEQNYDNATGDLRLEELLWPGAWDTDTARLVVLSGCETAVADTQNAPSESVTLATGWLRAGSVGVAGSLWVVDDLSTMLLMEHFYDVQFGAANAPSGGGVAPGPALRAAQLWLKDLTNEGVSARLAALAQLPGLSAEELDAIAAWREDYAGRPATAQSFTEPYWWAGFTYSGV